MSGLHDSSDKPFPGHPCEVVWQGDGKYRAECEPCGLVGKPQYTHAVTVGILRSHLSTNKHRTAMLTYQRSKETK